jgi:hypothetical protein
LHHYMLSSFNSKTQSWPFCGSNLTIELPKRHGTYAPRLASASAFATSLRIALA